MNIEIFQHGDAIFHEGEYAEKCYFMLHGKGVVYKRKLKRSSKVSFEIDTLDEEDLFIEK